ncbi:MAG: HigA family addiction module antitoxin [Alphaproteobacteria bacterium]
MKIEGLVDGRFLAERILRLLPPHFPHSRARRVPHGRRFITADTALRLGKYFGTTPELWLGLQMEYDMRCAKREVWPQIEPRIRPIQAV